MAYLLMVDDDNDFALAAATVLRGAGHEVAIEADVKAAVASMEQRLPDLVILDVMFPEDPAAGFALARRMRHFSEKLKDVPVLMLTAVNASFPLGFSTRDIDATWMPVSDFLEKPIDLSALPAKVVSLLSGSGRTGKKTGNA